MVENEPMAGATPAQNVTFDEWLQTMPEDVRARFDEGTAGLKKALSAERESGKALARQLKEITAKAEAGSELEKQLTALQGKLGESERRLSFMEGAPAAGCSNARAAYLIAGASDYFTADGAPDWDSIRAAAPELFGTQKPETRTHAGAGANQKPDAGNGHFMDGYIRNRLRN